MGKVYIEGEDAPHIPNLDDPYMRFIPGGSKASAIGSEHFLTDDGDTLFVGEEVDVETWIRAEAAAEKTPPAWNVQDFERFAKEATLAPVIGATLFGILTLAAKNEKPHYRQLHTDGSYHVHSDGSLGFTASDVHNLFAKSLAGDTRYHMLLGEQPTKLALAITDKYPLVNRYLTAQIPPHTRNEAGRRFYDASKLGEQFQLEPPYDVLDAKEIVRGAIHGLIHLDREKGLGHQSIHGLNYRIVIANTMSASARERYRPIALSDTFGNRMFIPETIATEELLIETPTYAGSWRERTRLHVWHREFNTMLARRENNASTE